MVKRYNLHQMNTEPSKNKNGKIEKTYGKHFGVRSDKKLGNYLKEKGYNSLSQLLKNV